MPILLKTPDHVDPLVMPLVMMNCVTADPRQAWALNEYRGRRLAPERARSCACEPPKRSAAFHAPESVAHLKRNCGSTRKFSAGSSQEIRIAALAGTPELIPCGRWDSLPKAV